MSLVPAVPAVPAPASVVPDNISYLPTLALTLAPVPYEAFIGTEFPQTPSPGRVIPKGSWLYDTCDCNSVEVEATPPLRTEPPALKRRSECCNCASASN